MTFSRRKVSRRVLVMRFDMSGKRNSSRYRLKALQCTRIFFSGKQPIFPILPDEAGHRRHRGARCARELLSGERVVVVAPFICYRPKEDTLH